MAATVLVGAAFAFYLTKSTRSTKVDNKTTKKSISEELAEAGLDQVKRHPSGRLDLQYLIKMLNLIASIGRERRKKETTLALA